MHVQQVVHHLNGVTSVHLLLPLRHHSTTFLSCQYFQAFAKQLGILREIGIVFQQQLYAFSFRQLHINAGAGPNGLDQGFRHADIAHFFAFGFDKHTALRIQLTQLVPDAGVKLFLTGLGLTRDAPQH